MSYDIEHNVDLSKTSKPPSSRRPDLSTFYSAVNETYGDEPTHNPHADATPANVTASYRLLADAYELMQNEHGENALLSQMIASLDTFAIAPPVKKLGVPDGFVEELDRVDKKTLKKDEACPICSEPFLDDKFPLVVRLPCHPSHKFDLECIRPWLKLNSTCPLDRKELVKKPEPPPKDEEEYDEEYESLYA